ncbi:hypothetical protein [Kribbella sp. DT2]|uniref:hypothetical protein n=1 Tax=Kribbella sp. DT2 TaxID=3393427 RepID=UPI003CE7A708
MIAAVTAITLRELTRRRGALALVALLPLAFYLVRIDTAGQAIRFLAIGVGWAVATLSLFTHVSSRHLDQRLAVVGASPTALIAGRQLALTVMGLALAVVYFIGVALTQDVARLWSVGLLLATSVLISAPLGAAVSLLVPRELEGALALLSIMALQMLADPAGTAAKLLPLWSSREFATYAVEPAAGASLSDGLLHFAAVTILAVAVTWIVGRFRLRPLRLPTPA